ncbi:CocE/NonD family hydrolase [Aaosphaeria arxii CBS 175.79]|uniref:CocE/NonD family hydrolase n=1 Tax=Aaosphaeria arxii CBS 175.79 TaxID=1450172 RepID=A0A6A5X7Q3_9PLEO|nr:CocE/NonD family hydrolase [Aaosphaeria arxii CBS 175.79]KAF2008962.1 CocE/NonD family hydrolase [Aaosphaeria arxii CBS 175.79]
MSMKGGIPETQFSSVYAHLYNWGHGLVEDAKDAITSHPYFDEYWQSKIPALERIECPVYIICGWGDHGIHTRGTLNAYYNINSKEKYLELHQYQKWEFAVSEESLSRQKAFLDRFLLGLSTEVLHWPKVRYTVRERFYVGDWRFASTFPLPNTTYTKMYPTMNKGLSLIALPNASSIAYDARKGKATFDFPVINPLEFVGHAKLKLWVEAKGAENMDLFVTLRKTDRHGNEVFFPWMTIIEDGPIAMGWLRVSRRELDQDRSKPWQPYHSHRRDLEPLKPGQIVPVEIEILPTSCKLRRGETLHVDISGHDYHENGYSKMIPLPRHTETVNQGEHIIHFGGQYDSHLYLPVLPPVSGSALESKKPVKMSLVARRVRGWTDEQFLSEYTGKHAEMTKAMASMVSVLRNYTQVVCCPPPRTERIKPSVYAPWDCMTTLAWSSLDGLWGSLQAPQYKASAGKHVFTDDESVGLLSESFIDFNFDPSQFLKRSSGYMVSLLLATSVSRETDELNLTEDLAARAETIKQVGAGTALLRYVLNRAITPPDPAGFFAGTPFSGFDWLTMGAMEQFWFPDLESINEFFRDTKRWETFQELPPSFNWDNSLLMIGKENVVVNKDLGI